MDDVDEKPRSFQLSRGRSGLSVFFLALAFGAVLIALPMAGPWIMRAMLIAAAIVCGAVVGCCALWTARSSGWRSAAVWGLAVAACFIAAAGAAILYLRNIWNPPPPIFGAGISPPLSLASAPLLTPLVAGVLAVLVVAGIVKLLRAAAAWPAK